MIFLDLSLKVRKSPVRFVLTWGGRAMRGLRDWLRDYAKW